MKNLIFALGCIMSCAKSKSDRQEPVTVVTPPGDSAGDDRPTADPNSSADWSGFEFDAEQDEAQLKLHRETLTGVWIIGPNQGRTDQGIRWEGVEVGDAGMRGGNVSIFSSDALGNTLTACKRQTVSKVSNKAFSKTLSNGGFLLDLRFEDGSFQQLLLKRTETGLIGKTLGVRPVDNAKVNIESYLSDMSGSIGNDLMRKVSIVCE